MARALDQIQPQIFVFGLVLIRIIDQVRAALAQRGFAGEHLAGAIEQGIDLGKVGLPGIGIVGVQRIGLVIVGIWTLHLGRPRRLVRDTSDAPQGG
ncbi:hypothetical protein [Microvirga tunisiensis]|uniref:hypothetical protein n=1 Tax=Microvirga tunisiensis TaxID=2108360 RepID=UPI001FCF0D98|nr:hypothetical protein [Microvirga tunisiensis]